MIFSIDKTVDENMVLYGNQGECTNGQYAAEGMPDLPSCVQQCLGEVQCLYVSYWEYPNGIKCGRYKSHSCNFKQIRSRHSIVTYQKVKIGTFDHISKMCLNFLNNLKVYVS